MLFGELNDSFLEKMKGYEILNGVPIPISETADGQIPLKLIFIDMAKVIGADRDFVFASKYLEYIKETAGEEAEPILISEAAKLADMGEYEDSCKLLRTALIIKPDSRAGLYLYGRACKACYEDEDKDADYVGSFKAEALETFEILTMMHPEFAMGYYFLGYGYLNLGLYLKAKLTFEDFIKYSSNSNQSDSGIEDNVLDDIRSEVEDIIADLEEPVKIEDGCNQINMGNYAGGLEVLSQYTEGRFKDWWPLWYYLGVAKSSLGNIEGAVSDYKKVLALSPSNIDVMEEIVALLEAIGDSEGVEKYRNKIEIVKRNIQEDSEG